MVSLTLELDETTAAGLEKKANDVGVAPEALIADAVVKFVANQVPFSIAADLYRRGVLSSTRSAELCGMEKMAFLAALGSLHISPFGYDADEPVLTSLR